MILEDYNNEDIENLDNLKKELLNISDEYENLKERVRKVFTSIKEMEFNKKRVQNPCIKCLVKPSCEFKRYIENEYIATDSPLLHHEGELCNPKLKSLLISEIKQDRRSDYYIEERTDHFFSKWPYWLGDTYVYPYPWNVDE